MLLPADVFENFRDMCLQHYGINPAHNYTSPGLSWQAAFKMTDKELDLLTDICQHLFIEERIRGGVATSHQDEEMKNLDVMMKPDENSRGSILECDLGKYYFYYLYIYVYFIKCISERPRDFIKCNVSYLCISEYPHDLHDVLKDYLLAPERLQIEENILNNYQRHLLEDEGFIKPTPKLVLILCYKTNYIIHYNWDCVSPTSMMFCCSINCHG